MSIIDLEFDNGDTALSSSTLYEIGTDTKQVFGQDESVWYTNLGTLYNAKWFIYNTGSEDVPSVSEGQFPCIRIKTYFQHPTNFTKVNFRIVDYRGGLVAGAHFIHTQSFEATAEWLAETHQDSIVAWKVNCEIYHVDASGVEQDRQDLGSESYQTLGDSIEHIKLEFDDTGCYVEDIATSTALTEPVIPLSDLSLYRLHNRYYNRGDDIINATNYPMSGVNVKFRRFTDEEFSAENLATVFSATLAKDTSTSGTRIFLDNFKDLDHAAGIVSWIAYFEVYYYNAADDRAYQDYAQVVFSINNIATTSTDIKFNDLLCYFRDNTTGAKLTNPTYNKSELDLVRFTMLFGNNGTADLANVEDYPAISTRGVMTRISDSYVIAANDTEEVTGLDINTTWGGIEDFSEAMKEYDHAEGSIAWELTMSLIYNESATENSVIDTFTLPFTVMTEAVEVEPKLLSFDLLLSENANTVLNSKIGVITEQEGSPSLVSLTLDRDLIWMNDSFENAGNLNKIPDYIFESIISTFTLSTLGTLEIQNLSTNEWVPITTSITIIELVSYLEGVVVGEEGYSSLYYKLRSNLRVVSPNAINITEYHLFYEWRLADDNSILSGIMNKNNNDFYVTYKATIIDAANAQVIFSNIPKDSDISALVYDITISTYAYIVPKSYVLDNLTGNFTGEVILTISAEDGTTRDWKILVEFESESEIVFYRGDLGPRLCYEDYSKYGNDRYTPITYEMVIPVKYNEKLTFFAKSENVGGDSAIGYHTFILYDFANRIISEETFNLGNMNVGDVSAESYSYVSMEKLLAIGTGKFYTYRYKMITNNETVTGKFTIESLDIPLLPYDTLAFNERIQRFTQKNFFPLIYLNNGSRMFTFPGLDNSDKSVMWRHGDGAKQTFYGQLTDFKLVFHVNTGQDRGSFKEFLSLMIESTKVSFESIIFETEQQTSEQNPFGNVKFWELPDYIEGRWQIPVSVQTVENNPLDSNADYEVGGYLRGSWLKITLVYRSSVPLYIKEVITNYIIQRTF